MADTQNKKRKSSQADPASPKNSKKKNPKVDVVGSAKKRSAKRSSDKKTATRKNSTEKKPNAELSGSLVDKLKKGLLHAYEVGANVVDELTRPAQEYAEKYKAESGIKKLNYEKDLVITKLGHSILKRRLTEGKITESLFNEKEISVLFNQIEMLDKQIIDIGKQLDTAKK